MTMTTNLPLAPTLGFYFLVVIVAIMFLSDPFGSWALAALVGTVIATLLTWGYDSARKLRTE